jgi:hypothetical protein
LALKFGGSGETVNMEFIHLVAGELAGKPIPMTRQIIPDNSSLVRHPDGETAMLVEPGPFNYAFMRWAAGQFTSRDLTLARWWRTKGPNLGQEALWTQLRDRGIGLPRPRGKVTAVVDDLLERESLQPLWLDYMLDQIEATEKFRSIVYDRWLRTEPKRLRDFAPYTHHCLRVVLAVLILTKHKLVSQKPSNFIDAQYLYYLPFCDVFVSGDKLHKRLVPEILRNGFHASERIERDAADPYLRSIARASPASPSGNTSCCLRTNIPKTWRVHGPMPLIGPTTSLHDSSDLVLAVISGALLLLVAHLLFTFRLASYFPDSAAR